MLARAGLYLRTAKHIPLSQLWYFVWRRILPQNRLAAAPVEAGTRIPAHFFQLAKPLRAVKPCLHDGRFEFLSQTSSFGIDKIDWRAQEYPKLWRYHLHYFDWLKDAEPDDHWAAHSIYSWIIHNPAGCSDAWEPYPVSLRLVNWIKYFCAREQAAGSLSEEWLFSLVQQGEWLNRNIEYHIRANHLFKNIVAMIWFCAFMQSEPTYRTWLKRYCDLLLCELDEQFNADGGHYERSPMYHAICLEDCLDLFNLLHRAGVDHPCVGSLASVIQRGLAFLRLLSFSDDKVALFGDSTLHGCHDWKTLSAYWKQLNGTVEDIDETGGKPLVHCPDSGFVIRETSHYKIIISSGGVSPGYQPGHTHCDMGSFELCTPHGRLVVDSGVSQYAQGELRRYSRSSLAHNVVMVNGDNQHELWGEFRVGSRATIELLKLAMAPTDCGDEAEIILRISSHSACGTPWRQTRAYHLGEHQIDIVDIVQSSSNASIESNFHLHPDVDIQPEGDGFNLRVAGDLAARIAVSDVANTTIEHSYYCPDFGVVLNGQRICLQRHGSTTTRMAVRIELDPAKGGVDA